MSGVSAAWFRLQSLSLKTFPVSLHLSRSLNAVSGADAIHKIRGSLHGTSGAAIHEMRPKKHTQMIWNCKA